MNLIIATDDYGTFGYKGGLAYSMKEDQQYFKKVTRNSTVVMGRGTWESLPDKYKPLPNRRNVVITNKSDISGAEAMTLSDFRMSESQGEFDDAFLIGGAKLLKTFLDLDLIDVAYVTFINSNDVEIPAKVTDIGVQNDVINIMDELKLIIENFKGYDILETHVGQCRINNIEVYASMTKFTK